MDLLGSSGGASSDADFTLLLPIVTPAPTDPPGPPLGDDGGSATGVL